MRWKRGLIRPVTKTVKHKTIASAEQALATVGAMFVLEKDLCVSKRDDGKPYKALMPAPAIGPGDRAFVVPKGTLAYYAGQEYREVSVKVKNTNWRRYRYLQLVFLVDMCKYFVPDVTLLKPIE